MNKATADDQEIDALLARIANGDVDARGELFDLMGAELFGLCTHVLPDEASACEAMVDAFDTMTLHAPDRCGSARAWMHAVTRAAAVNRKRRSGDDVAMTLPHMPPALPEFDDISIGYGMMTLDPSRSEALRQVWLGGATYETLSRYFDVRPAQVRNWLRRTLPRLRGDHEG